MEAVAMGGGTIMALWLALVLMSGVVAAIVDALRRSGQQPYLLRYGRAHRRAASLSRYYRDVGVTGS
jgi:hypothetical protein